MLLSQLFQEFNEYSYTIENEKPFQYLGLVASMLKEDMCIFLEKERFIKDIPDNVTMVITNTELKDMLLELGYGICVVSEPRNCFFKLHNYLKNYKGYVRDQFTTQIDESAQISTLSSVAKNNVKIGRNVVIEEFVVIRENTVIEDDAVICAGSVIGGVGFECKKEGNTQYVVEHLGGVIIKQGVEIQNNTCVDRAVYPWDNTIIGEYTKIDNLVQIAHAVKIGRCCLLAAKANIAGRTVIGEHVWIGPNAMVSNGLVIGDRARVALGSVVTKSVKEDKTVFGNPAKSLLT